MKIQDLVCQILQSQGLVCQISKIQDFETQGLDIWWSGLSDIVSSWFGNSRLGNSRFDLQFCRTLTIQDLDIKDLPCRIFYIQDLVCLILKSQDLKIQDLVCLILKIEDLDI